MQIQMLSSLRKGALVVAAFTIAAGVLAYVTESPLRAQDDAGASSEAKPQDAAKKKRRHAAHKAATKPTPAAQSAAAATDTKSSVAASAAQSASVEPAAAKARDSNTSGGPVDFSAQLDKAGASGCRAQVNALAASTMSSVVKFNTVSNWAPASGDKRAVAMAIGQRYPDGSKVPFGVAQIVSAPNQQGSCDGFVTQVFPSPLSCGKLRDSIAVRGRQIGDLAGIPLMQDANGQSMLIPTSADTCVLVTSRAVYLK